MKLNPNVSSSVSSTLGKMLISGVTQHESVNISAPLLLLWQMEPVPVFNRVAATARWSYCAPCCGRLSPQMLGQDTLRKRVGHTQTREQTLESSRQPISCEVSASLLSTLGLHLLINKKEEMIVTSKCHWDDWMFTNMVAGTKRYSFHGGLCLSCLAGPHISKMYYMNVNMDGKCLSLSIGAMWESHRGLKLWSGGHVN